MTFRLVLISMLAVVVAAGPAAGATPGPVTPPPDAFERYVRNHLDQQSPDAFMRFLRNHPNGYQGREHPDGFANVSAGISRDGPAAEDAGKDGGGTAWLEVGLGAVVAFGLVAVGATAAVRGRRLAHS
jgi:hypothetical protein